MIQFKFFSIPAQGDEVLEDELNRFMRSHRIITKTIKLCDELESPTWAVCVEYNSDAPVKEQRHSPATGKGERIDYRERLSDEDFKVYSKLRDVRKELAAAKGVEIFLVMTNAQLAEMVTSRCRSLADIRKIQGIGDAKIKDYGEAFLEALLASWGSETGTESAEQTS